TGAGRADFAGTIDGDRIDGRYTLAISDLSRLSAAAGRDIAGALNLTGTVRAANGAHAVTVDGEVREPRTGADAADRLLGSRVTLKGGVSRSADGTVQFDDLTVAAQHLTATIAGQAGAQTARLEARGTVMDLGTVSASLGGSIDFAATVSGTMDDAVIEASATGS